jgi:hypothetical protein
VYGIIPFDRDVCDGTAQLTAITSKFPLVRAGIFSLLPRSPIVAMTFVAVSRVRPGIVLLAVTLEVWFLKWGFLAALSLLDVKLYAFKSLNMGILATVKWEHT